MRRLACLSGSGPASSTAVLELNPAELQAEYTPASQLQVQDPMDGSLQLTVMGIFALETGKHNKLGLLVFINNQFSSLWPLYSLAFVATQLNTIGFY